MTADGHTDFVNSARTWLSKHILHKIIYRHFAKTLEPCTEKFFGVTPLRVVFFRDVYGIDEKKLDLLVLGMDDSETDLGQRDSIRNETRKRIGVQPDDFVIICGGKIDKRKNIHVLLEAYSQLKTSSAHSSTKLVIFGVPTEEMSYLTEQMAAQKDIIYLGWLNPGDVNPYILASDLACFPGTHSVLWEQVVGLGVPALFRRWKGMEHVDVGGNCLFLEEDGVAALTNALKKIINDKDVYSAMMDVARSRGTDEFSYYRIASQAIGQETTKVKP
ncbi:MAG: glycosyltransferase family 4 protein [Zetaproteobacteria bacterium]|nr:glycosyltransferase family 4 protein [Zetaproteobacteria bacterium]